MFDFYLSIKFAFRLIQQSRKRSSIYITGTRFRADDLEPFRIEAGFFVYYTILGFCFICGPLAIMGYVFRLSNQTLPTTSAILTNGAATLLCILTNDDLNQELKRQRETSENELPPMLQDIKGGFQKISEKR
jgi:hypothetical protein